METPHSVRLLKAASWITSIAIVAVLLTARGASAGSILLGTTGNGTTLSTLVQIDPATGNLVNTIGSVGYTVNGLTYDATTGTLYGSTGIMGAYNGLITIDMTTGAGTPVGSGWGSPAAITNVTTNSSGQMYGWWDPGQDDLVRIDKSAGTFSLVGESGVGTATNGLSFDNSNVLWMVNGGGEVYTVDPITGAAVSTGSIGITAHHGDFDPTSGLYFGIDTTGSNPKNLVVANLALGTVVDTRPTIDGLHTLTFVPEASVPDPGYGMPMLLLGLSALGAMRRFLM
jgi:hypothetical protein